MLHSPLAFLLPSERALPGVARAGRDGQDRRDPNLRRRSARGRRDFFVGLVNPQGLKLGSPVNAPVKIIDDEMVLQFSGRFVRNLPEVVRTGSMQGTVSVDYVAASGTAILNEDFVLPPGRLVFPPGVASLTIPIKGLGDNLVEGTETFTLTLLNPSEPARLGPRFEQIVLLDDSDFGAR